MPFNPVTFANEAMLGLIPTDQLPSAAQDAMENGFDGPSMVRLAILDPQHGWAIDQAIPPLLEELGQKPANKEEAALNLARIRAERILASGEDPLASMAYFSKLWVAADYSTDLMRLGCLDDEVFLAMVMGRSIDQRQSAIEVLREFLSA